VPAIIHQIPAGFRQRFIGGKKISPNLPDGWRRRLRSATRFSRASGPSYAQKLLMPPGIFELAANTKRRGADSAYPHGILS